MHHKDTAAAPFSQRMMTQATAASHYSARRMQRKWNIERRGCGRREKREVQMVDQQASRTLLPGACSATRSSRVSKKKKKQLHAAKQPAGQQGYTSSPAPPLLL
jgi:hypothetical protein